jgi:hypothetical protein
METPFLNTYMSRSEGKGWPWISRMLKPGMIVLSRASSSLNKKKKK